ncbi:DNA-binding FadR family transcriptional regulator [Oikeobacillus pervagus]|uniref:DNA-binding FadR family transcriptional regulator n=1 Tax=Oikeobacillus pervagus TaxID=1325931 RepID=A0AAJ1T1B5_9BACI|nr:FadR/GntR family transcriptional regulator [Oikeobacillus pervagus]MDQ0215002.1 DNA-binding FadR family transcriptional regulator [Oikeobacillus pervagus]
MAPQSKKKTYQVIVDQLKEHFLNGDMKQGDKLPTERELASQFKVSRTSVREALRKLEMKGIIETRQGSGSFIKSIEFQSFGEELSSAIVNTERKLVYEMLELRRVLEMECAYLASHRATSKDLEKIRQALEDMVIAKNDVELGLKADVNFHINIVSASNNTIFLTLIQTLNGQLQDNIRATRMQRFSNPERIEDTIDEHKQIYLAIASGNGELAKNLMENHILQIRKEFAESSLHHLKG